MNDCGVDIAGRFWMETFDDAAFTVTTEVAQIWCLNHGQLEEMEDGMTIPNGISWNVKDDKMYLANSPTKNVYAHDYEPVSGAISNN